MKLVDSISLTDLRQMAEKMYGTLVKADVDIAQKRVLDGAVGGVFMQYAMAARASR